ATANADLPFDPHRSPLRSAVTTSVPELLWQLGVSLCVSTYQAGFVVLLRAESRDQLNSHFRHFPRPMGMAAHPQSGRIAIGTEREIVQFHNMTAVCEKLEPPGRHDACYLPRHSHITGDIDVHEMAWGDARDLFPLPRIGGEGQGEGTSGVQTSTPPSPPMRGRGSGTFDRDPHPSTLDPPISTLDPPTSTFNPCLFFINTQFSCLCTLDEDHSFVPVWWPKFVSSLGVGDRCHLNGLGLVEGRPKYVTALGAMDTPAGWRANKARGGVLIDVGSDEIISSGLSMPHSPRWYDGRLWLLESGDGSFGAVDLRTGRYEAIAKLNGFTRGISFAGPFAFIGLSQVRESAVFSGIPIVERVKERTCGVAVVDLRSGRQVGYVQFQDAVQEIFAVEVLPHRFPELLEPRDELVGNAYSLPDDALRFVGNPSSNEGCRQHPKSGSTGYICPSQESEATRT
ncbi:MAG TPA: TIGR03032 family protein, partial [Planctomycetaceae bacterium]|nr:TIGR03032 family protein [Planctomycetaceae bacterium]